MYNYYKHTLNPWESNYRDGPTGHDYYAIKNILVHTIRDIAEFSQHTNSRHRL